MTIRDALGPMVVAVLLAIPVAASAECQTVLDQDGVRVETCPIGRTGYSLVQTGHRGGRNGRGGRRPVADGRGA